MIQCYLYISITHPIRGYEPREPKELTSYILMTSMEFNGDGNHLNETDCGTTMNCLLEVQNSKTKTLFTIVS